MFQDIKSKFKAELDALLKRGAEQEEIKKFFQTFANLDELTVKCVMWGHHFMPRYFSDSSPDFHYELIRKFFSHKNEYTACPRGFGKTTIVQLCVCFSIVNGLDEFIVLIEKNFTEATEVLEGVREAFKYNDEVQRVYGDLMKISPRLKTEEEVRDAAGDFFINGIRLRGKGFDAPIRGLKSRHTRPTRIILDDVESDEHIDNDEQRLKYLNNYTRGIIPAADIEVGAIKMFGTILHDDSLLNTLVNQHKGQIYRAWDEKKTLLWASKWSVEKLEQKRVDMQVDVNGDAAWYQEYFNEPLSEENQIFRRDFFRYYNDFQLEDIRKKPHRIYTLVDPAISKKMTADFTAIVTLLVDIMGRIYWLEIIRERLNPMETIRALFAAYERWKPEKVGVETVAYQKALIYFIEEEKRRTASLVKNMIVQEIRADSDKERKIRGLQPKYAIGSVFHRENDPMTRILEQELLRFPKAAHDDIIDAGSGVLQLIIPPKKPVKEAYGKWGRDFGGAHRQVSY